MPRLTHDTGNMGLILRVTQDEAVFPAMLRQPDNRVVLSGVSLRIAAVCDVESKTQVMLAGAGNGTALQSQAFCIGVTITLVLIFLQNFIEQHLLRVDRTMRTDNVGTAARCGTILKHFSQNIAAFPGSDSAGQLHKVGIIIIGNREPGVDHDDVGTGVFVDKKPNIVVSSIV